MHASGRRRAQYSARSAASRALSAVVMAARAASASSRARAPRSAVHVDGAGANRGEGRGRAHRPPPRERSGRADRLNLSPQRRGIRRIGPTSGSIPTNGGGIPRASWNRSRSRSSGGCGAAPQPESVRHRGVPSSLPMRYNSLMRIIYSTVVMLGLLAATGVMIWVDVPADSQSIVALVMGALAREVSVIGTTFLGESGRGDHARGDHAERRGDQA